jgi:hypothetical protein
MRVKSCASAQLFSRMKAFLLGGSHATFILLAHKLLWAGAMTSLEDCFRELCI